MSSNKINPATNTEVPQWWFIFMHAFVLSCFSSVRLFATLWTIACQAPLSMGFSRQECWSGLPVPSYRGSSRSRDWTQISYVSYVSLISHWQVSSLPVVPSGKSLIVKLSTNLWGKFKMLMDLYLGRRDSSHKQSQPPDNIFLWHLCCVWTPPLPLVRSGQYLQP